MNGGTALEPKIAGRLPAQPRILLVDDDERNLLALETAIEDLGEVITARSGEDALRELLQGDFAVILLDVFMPGLDGYETARLIRGRSQSSRIPIIFLSAVNKEDEHLMRGYEMGAVDYVFKPVEARVLRSKVAVFVDLYAMQQDVERKAEAEQRLLSKAVKAREQQLATERELQRSRQRQSAIISSMPFLLFLVNRASGTPQFLDDNFRDLTGFEPGEANAEGFWLERVHADDREALEKCFAERRAGRACSREYRWQDAGGKYRHFLDQAALSEDQDDEMVGTILDVSERRELEAQLLQVQKMDAIGQLTGGIAHDFNNLLAAVLGGLRMIRSRAQIAEKEMKVLDMTEHAARQGVDLITRMLAFSRKQQLTPAAVSLDRLEAGVRDLLAHSLGGLVEIDWEADADAPAIFADAAQLELAVMNLVINARDSMPDGGRILVSCLACEVREGDKPGLEPGPFVRIRVSDEGSGIPHDKIAQVTEPFYTTKEVGKGTGLGLSMVYGFAHQSGGALDIESEVGKGTSVEIWLPAHVGEADKAPSSSPAQAQEALDPLNIALVDDDDAVRLGVAEMLRDLGHAVTDFGSAHDALEAMIAAEPSTYDLLVSDYAMPRMSGLDLIVQARKISPDTRALLITGYADTSELAAKAGGIAVLGKPFDPGDLNRVVGNLFAENARGARACPTPAD